MLEARTTYMASTEHTIKNHVCVVYGFGSVNLLRSHFYLSLMDSLDYDGLDAKLPLPVLFAAIVGNFMSSWTTGCLSTVKFDGKIFPHFHHSS